MSLVRWCLLGCLCVLFSCNGGGGDNPFSFSGAKDQPNKTLPLGPEIENLNQQFNSSTQYALSSEELSSLLSEGVISQSQYNELLKLAKK